MLTGQISSHALQLVHAHTSSGVMRSNTLSAPIEMSRSVPTGGDTTGSPVRGHDLADLQHDLARVERLAGRVRGHTDVQRPQTVHASVSISCFQVKSSIFTAPKLSSSVSMRFGIGFIAPLGRSLVLQVHVHRRREHVAQLRGRQDREEREERDHVRRPTASGA